MTTEDVISNPAATFKRPEDVCDDSRLSRAEKIKVLQRWEYDAREMEVAEEENMASGTTDKVTLADVLAALNELGVTADGSEAADKKAPTKQGGV